MKLLKKLVIAGLAIAIIPSAFAQKKHLFILTGQSNMARMKPELGFTPEAKKLFAGDEIKIVYKASPGKQIRQWLSEWYDIADKNGIEYPQKTAKEKTPAFYGTILKMVKKQMQKNKFDSVTFCWMQGEADSRGKYSAIYKEALTTMIAKFRRVFKAPEMNVVVGRISDSKKYYREEYAAGEHWDKVREIQVEVANEDPRGAWVDCDDMNGEDDDLHYSKEGYVLLGQRFARQAFALVNGKEPAANGRPE